MFGAVPHRIAIRCVYCLHVFCVPCARFHFTSAKAYRERIRSEVLERSYVVSRSKSLARKRSA